MTLIAGSLMGLGGVVGAWATLLHYRAGTPWRSAAWSSAGSLLWAALLFTGLLTDPTPIGLILLSLALGMIWAGTVLAWKERKQSLKA